jgi:uncharacterized membrane protein
VFTRCFYARVRAGQFRAWNFQLLLRAHFWACVILIRSLRSKPTIGFARAAADVTTNQTGHESQSCKELLRKNNRVTEVAAKESNGSAALPPEAQPC